jgi:LuxR family maltose regulon positive regulatory protein
MPVQEKPMKLEAPPKTSATPGQPQTSRSPYVPLSKISPPPLRHVLDRSRLRERIEENRDKKCILILGQAAQGKSTLAASYVNASDIPWAWMNLDREDSDPVDLFRLMIASLHYHLNDEGLGSLFAYTGPSLGPREKIYLYREWIRVLFGKVSLPVQMIFDGLDHLSPQADGFQFFQVLLERVPAHVHLFILSRNVPPFPIHDLEMKQQVHVVTNEELAFTQPEVRAFFCDSQALPLSSKPLKRILELTEGWAGGLVLLAQALRRLPESEREDYLLHRIPSSFNRDIFKYFDTEILAPQEKSIQDFLIKTSLFETIEPGLVDALLETTGSEKILKRLAEASLFVQETYSKRTGWHYRFHQLLKDFLVIKFESELDTETQHSLFLKAGSLYEERGRPEDALKAYLKVKSLERATSVIEQIGATLMDTGRMQDLAIWLDSIPEALILKNPWLLFYLSMTRRFKAPEENVKSLQRSLALFEEQGDFRGQILSLAYLIEAAFYMGRDLVPFRPLLERGEKMLNLSSRDTYVHEKGVLWLQIGYGYTLRGNNPKRGFEACQNAYLLARNTGDRILERTALIYSLLPLTFMGEFSESDAIQRKAGSLARKVPYPELDTIQLLVEMQLELFRGNLKRTGLLMETVTAQIDRHGLVYLAPLLFFAECLFKIHQRRYSEAREVGERLLHMATSLGHTFGKAMAFMMLGTCAYHAEVYEDGEKWIIQSMDSFLSDDFHSDMHLHVCKLVLSLIDIHLQDYERAERMALEAISYFENISSVLFLSESHLSLGLLDARRGRARDAHEHLLKGLQIAEEKGFNHFMALNPVDGATACCLALELEIPGATEHTGEILVKRLHDAAVPELRKLRKHPKKQVRKKARSISNAIHRTGLPRLEIHSLGGFQVFKEKDPLEEEAWFGNQPKILLKAILSYDSKGIREDILMENLWPEKSSVPQKKNFKVALHRLRKSLEPEMSKEIGSSYVRLKDHIVSLDEILWQVQRCIREGEKREEGGDIKGALSSYEQAGKLYKGDFLPEETYTPWIEAKRRKIRDQYLAVLLSTAQLHEARGAMKKAASAYEKMLKIDPVSEKACQRLMVLYGSLGKKNEGLKVYGRLKRALRDELGVAPDRMTVSILKKSLTESEN